MSAATVKVERRRNRITNPSFQSNTTGWTAVGTSTLGPSAVAADGSISGLITFAAGGPATQGAGTTVTGLTVGAVYTVSAYVWVPAASLTAAPALHITGLGPVGSAVTAADQWVRVGGTFTATATSHTVTLLNTGTTTAGQTTFFDRVLLEESTVLGNYFDGATAATGSGVGARVYAWTGSANASASVEYELVIRFVITPTVEADTTPPRVRVDVIDRDVAATGGVVLTRLDPAGRTRPVRTIDGGPLALTVSGPARLATIYDYEVPYGAPVAYSTAEAPGTASAPVTVDVDRPWLVHPGAPALSMPLWIAELAPRVRDVEQAVLRPMHREFPIVHTDGRRKAPVYDMTVRTGTLQELDAIEALCADAQILLLNVPVSLEWGIGAEYIAVGRISESRLNQYGPEKRRHWLLPCTVTDRPEGGTTASRTLADVAAEAPTLAGLAALYETLYDMAMG